MDYPVQFAAMFCLAAAIILLALALYCEGRELVKYRLYKGSTQARLDEIKPFAINQSKGMVEEKAADGAFRPVKGTEDKSAQYPPFYHLLFEKNRYQLCMEWQCRGDTWRAHYPYLQSKDEWRVGDSVELHYAEDKPWHYAINDPKMLQAFVVKCGICFALLVIGAALLHFAG